MKTFIWGTGEHCDDRLHCYPQILDNVIGFIDSDTEKQGNVFYEKTIYAPEILKETEFDCILIAVVGGYKAVYDLCLSNYGIETEKIKTIDEHITSLLLEGSMPIGEVCIDASTMCQLDCAQCYMRKDDYGAVGCGYLKFSDFKRFIDENPEIKSVELANSGEVFLNPDLKDIISYGYEKGVRISAWDGVNFNTVSDEMLELLVQKQFRMITIALDGASQETYEKYRRKGDFNQVIANIRKLNEYKKKYNSRFPTLNWQYIIMETTENDIAAAKELAKELNMTIKFRLTWDYSYVPGNPERIKRETGLQFATRKEYDDHNDKQCMTGCLQFFTRPQFNWDGRLLGCKCIYLEDFGLNMFETSYKEVMSHPKIQSARELVKGRLENLDDQYEYPCKRCKFFVQMKKAGSYTCTEKFY